MLYNIYSIFNREHRICIMVFLYVCIWYSILYSAFNERPSRPGLILVKTDKGRCTKSAVVSYLLNLYLFDISKTFIVLSNLWIDIKITFCDFEHQKYWVVPFLQNRSPKIFITFFLDFLNVKFAQFWKIDRRYMYHFFCFTQQVHVHESVKYFFSSNIIKKQGEI